MFVPCEHLYSQSCKMTTAQCMVSAFQTLLMKLLLYDDFFVRTLASAGEISHGDEKKSLQETHVLLHQHIFSSQSLNADGNDTPEHVIRVLCENGTPHTIMDKVQLAYWLSTRVATRHWILWKIKFYACVQENGCQYLLRHRYSCRWRWLGQGCGRGPRSWWCQASYFGSITKFKTLRFTACRQDHRKQVQYRHFTHGSLLFWFMLHREEMVGWQRLAS